MAEIAEIPEDVRAVAGRIVAFYEMMNNRFDERRDSAEWKGAVSAAAARYQELKRTHSFSEASSQSMAEAVASILVASAIRNPLTNTEETSPPTQDQTKP